MSKKVTLRESSNEELENQPNTITELGQENKDVIKEEIIEPTIDLSQDKGLSELEEVQSIQKQEVQLQVSELKEVFILKDLSTNFYIKTTPLNVNFTTTKNCDKFNTYEEALELIKSRRLEYVSIIKTYIND